MRRLATISHSVRWCLLLASIAAAPACAPPLQNGGVEVRSGASERLGIVCRWSRESLCGSMQEQEQEQAEPAPAPGSAAPQDNPAGALAVGRAGDLPRESGNERPMDPAR